MPSRPLLAVVAALSLSCPASVGAAEPKPPAKEIRKRFWQHLPGIRLAAVDNRGDAWLFTRHKCSIEQSYGSDFKLMPESRVLLLGDRQGRLWLNDRYRNAPTSMYDGKEWHKLGFRAAKALEDSAGRVFLVGPKQFHVLERGKWAVEKHHSGPVGPNWRVLEDRAGNVWIWACRGKPPHRPAGAWSFRGGRWTRHTTQSGFPIDRVEMIAPLAGGRYLLTTDDPAALPNFVVWSWRQAGGKPIPKTEQHDFLAGVSARHLRYEGIDDDGSYYFAATGLIQNHQEAYKGETVAVCFPPGSPGRVLTPDGTHFFRDVLRRGERLYFSLKDPNAWDGERVHRLPIDGPLSGRDRLGRTYFVSRSSQSHPSCEIQVLWPACEKPGDLIRPLGRVTLDRTTRRQQAGTGRAFRDPAGDIWYLGDRRLLRWGGEGWQATPVERKGHPPWRAEPAPPWYAFNRGIHVVPGREGTLLAVTVRDVYQDAGPARRGGRIGWRAIRKRGADAQKAGSPVYWLEGWLWRNGRWTGPRKIRELIEKEIATFRKHFTAQTPAPAYFDLQSDGRRVWMAQESTVYAFLPDGSTATWDIPRPKSWHRLLPVNLLLLPGGKTWCAYHSADRDLEVVSLTVRGGRIEAEALPAAGMKNNRYARWTRFHVSRDGQLWRWHAGDTGSWYALRSSPFLWRDGAWRERKDLGGLLREDDDGALWFLRKIERVTDRGYDILHKGVLDRLTWPVHRLPMGLVTQAAPGVLLAACGHYVVSVVRSGGDKGGRWKIGRVHLLADQPEHGGVFLDGRGHIIGASGWWAKFPVKVGR